ncbi:MAG: helix-turn-helix domain-containing protein [Chloroflexi bacterium]|nr:helix-turn-helix domain-containing protein [Chloroflexota bacterium]
MKTTRARRRVTVVDNSHVARRIGDRIREARTRAELTQADVARGRYTAAYISALERGLAKPSMAALTFLSERLGVAITDLVAEEPPAAARLEADLLLAAGDAQRALDAYETLLDRAGSDRRQRAELLRGRAEALCRLGKGREAIRPASEAAELFSGLGHPADAAMARYWLAYAQYQDDNPAEARGILVELLADDRRGIAVAPDFRFRLLAALGNVEAWDGQPDRAIAYMEEARALTGSASVRQRAAFLSGLALQYRRVGDLEASLRAGQEALGLYGASDTERDEASLEINLGLVFLQMGNLDRSQAHLDRARALAEACGDERLAADVIEADAQLALARGDEERAHRLASSTLDRLATGASFLAGVGAHLTLARVARRRGLRSAAEDSYRSAADLLEAHHAVSRRRDVLGEWAGMLTELGDLAAANALYAEALGRGTGVRSAER